MRMCIRTCTHTSCSPPPHPLPSQPSHPCAFLNHPNYPPSLHSRVPLPAPPHAPSSTAHQDHSRQLRRPRPLRRPPAGLRPPLRRRGVLFTPPPTSPPALHSHATLSGKHGTGHRASAAAWWTWTAFPATSRQPQIDRRPAKEWAAWHADVVPLGLAGGGGGQDCVFVRVGGCRLQDQG